MTEDYIPAARNSALAELKSNRQAVALALLAVLVASSAYVLFTGLTVYMSDTFLLANRAKHLAGEFNLQITQSASPTIYPPLYSVVLAIAYLFREPSTIFAVTLAIHVLLTVSQVFPLFLLLRHYGELAPRPAAALAAALALSPASLPYTSMGLAEALFCPIVLWLAYCLCRVWTLDDAMQYIAAGVFLALALLTRSAAASLVLAFGCTALLARKDDYSRNGVAVAGIFFGAVYGAWYLFELLFIHYSNPNYIFSLSEVGAIFTSFSRLDLHASWLANCVLYYLYAPLSLAGAFSFVLFLRRPSLLRADPVALFFLLAMFCSAAVPSLVLGDYFGGRDLTWNRYVMPCVVFSSLIAIRYRACFNRATLFSAALLLAAGFLAVHPSSLSCHFTDALALAGKQSRPPLADVLINFLFLLVPVLSGWLWLRAGRRRQALTLTAAFWIATHVAAAIYYRNSGDFNISNYHGIAEKAHQISRSKATQVFYDPANDLKDATAAETVLYYWPDLRIQPLPQKDLATVKIPAGTSLLYFTTTPVPGLEPIGVDRGVLRLYEITGPTASAAATPVKVTALSIVPGPNMPGVELGDKDNRKVPVRWLGSAAEFFVDAPPGVDEVTVQLTLGTFGMPRTASLTVNGAPAAPAYRVEGDFWSTPPTTASFRTRLKPGRNECKVTAAEPPSKLPDGREVLFLLVGDIAVEPVTNQSK